jgi:hypothetical protein
MLSRATSARHEQLHVPGLDAPWEYRQTASSRLLAPGGAGQAVSAALLLRVVSRDESQPPLSCGSLPCNTSIGRG